jgi:hypothetical protein
MRIGIIECKHCKTDYHYQFSGNDNAIDTPPDLRDNKYCPECKGAINQALTQIPIKFEWKYLPTDAVTLQELLDIENTPTTSTGLLPVAKRVFGTMWSTERNENSRAGEVKYKNKTYHYSYWPSKSEEAIITVKTKVKL